MTCELKKETQKKMEEQWELQHEAMRLLCLVVAEWDSDPSSVNWFDLRVIERAKEVTKRYNKISEEVGGF